jgi:hypothetical protein
MNKYQDAFEKASLCCLCTDTVEEAHEYLDVLKELVDKAVPKKSDYEADGYDENGELIYDTWICPNCDKKYEVDYDEYDHCPNCGQAIDWSDENVE